MSVARVVGRSCGGGSEVYCALWRLGRGCGARTLQAEGAESAKTLGYEASVTAEEARGMGVG